MSEYIDEQISEFIDDEMSAEECEFFVRRLQRDASARARYARFQMIGVAVRGEHLPFKALGEAPVRLELGAGEPSEHRGGHRSGRGHLAAGFGIAAGIALVALVGFQMSGIGFGNPDDSPIAGSEFAELGGARIGQAAATQSEVMGMQYLMQHTGYATGLSRTIMHSGVISGTDFDWDDDVGADTAGVD